MDELRRRVAAAREGKEFILETEALAPPPRASSVVDFWQREYLAAHGTSDLAFSRADGVILAKLVPQFEPAEHLAWMIHEFHATHDEWLEEGGWSVKQFATRTRGLHLRWVREVWEPKLRDEKRLLQRELEALSKDPKLANVIEGLFTKGGKKT